MKVLDLFSGIGGFSLGLEKAGFETVRFCEIDEDCRQVLKRHSPNISISEDVRELSLPEGFADVITGGFPCQDLSAAGKREGLSGERSGLWYQMRRIISEVRPKFAIVENVPNFLSGNGGAWFGEFLGSLAEIGYDAEWRCISAAELGFPHKRERLWIVAYPKSFGLDVSIFEEIKLPQNTQRQKEAFGGADIGGYCYPAIPEHIRMDDGLPFELDEIKSRIRMLGNSIVPEIAYLIAFELKKYF